MFLWQLRNQSKSTKPMYCIEVNYIKIYYYTFTGQVANFVEKLPDKFRCEEVSDGIHAVDERFVLITTSIGQGETPEPVLDFLYSHHENLVGVIGSGNKVWGRDFCGGAIKVARQYNVPLLHKFEYDGLTEDVEIAIQELERIDRQIEE